MFKKFAHFLLIAFLFANLITVSQIYAAPEHKLKFDNAADEYSQIEQYQKEIQNLISKIEILEHRISILEQQIKSANIALIKPQEVVDNKSLDVFDVSVLNEEKSKEPLLVQQVPAAHDIGEDKSQYDLALASLKENKPQEAEQKFAEFLTQYPKSSLISNAYFWYGETFFRRNIFDKATINYLKGYKHSPKGVKAADSLLKLAIALGELNKKQEACGVLAKLDTEFPSRSASSIKRTKDTKVKLGCKKN